MNASDLIGLDAPTLSAIAAAAAAIAAATVAGIQLYVGHRQSKAALVSAQAAMINAHSSGRHTIAEFRQKWIDKVIDALSEHHAILTAMGEGLRSGEENQKLAALRTKLEILLNPTESDTVALLTAIDAVDAVKDESARLVKSREAISIARRLLKTEWMRIKNELK